MFSQLIGQLDLILQIQLVFFHLEHIIIVNTYCSATQRAVEAWSYQTVVKQVKVKSIKMISV